jgi:phytoene dehydrogenase-like protein
MPDVIIIGGGLNGLVAGAWLAKRKFATLILERRPHAGGAAVTTEIAPGFKAPGLSHAIGPLHRDVIRAFDLDRAAGLQFMTPDPAVTSLGNGDGHVVFHRDPVLTAASIHRVSPRDAGQWQAFLQSAQRVSSVVAMLQRHAPPNIDDVGATEMWRLLGAGRLARSLGRRDLARLLRWLPMAVADLASEWFDHDLVRAAIAARAIFGSGAGPRSAGTGAALLQRMAEDPMPIGSGVTLRGGPGALADALVAIARRAGAEVATDVRVAQVMCESGRATGVILENGAAIAARAVVSAIDPRQTLLDLVDPADLPPSFTERMRHYRARGVTAKINLALSALPEFPALHGDAVPLRGRFLVAPTPDYLERAHDAAKYGRMSDEPWLELAIPSVSDPSLAPAGSHVMSIYAQAAPRHLRESTWDRERDALYARVLAVLEPHAPGIGRLVVQREVITPEDLETGWGLSGGHIFHGEPAIDQSWVARPLIGWAQYRTPLDGLFLASAGTHPGGGLTGMSGLLAARAVERRLRRKSAASR